MKCAFSLVRLARRLVLTIVSLPEPLLTDRTARTARKWSNRELRQLAPHFPGDVVNVSAWQDNDKEGGTYQEYFSAASSYHVTNLGGHRGRSGRVNEHSLDLTSEVPADLVRRFDVAFNHTTLEHIFNVRRAFRNVCDLSKDVVIIVVPFSQVQHESVSYGDYWRFTPTCLRSLFAENGMELVYEAESDLRRSAIYLLVVASREASRWRSVLPPLRPIEVAGRRIGYSRTNRLYAKIRSSLLRLLGSEIESNQDCADSS